MKPLPSLMIALLLLALAAVWVEARAGECTWLGLNVGSHHFDKEEPKDYEQHNWGPHLEYCLGREDLRAFGGWYRNSHRRDSVYAGVVWAPLKAGPARLGLALARVSGYGDVDIVEHPDGRKELKVKDEPIFAPFPVLMVEGRSFGANVMYVPKTSQNDALLAWSVKWRWR